MAFTPGILTDWPWTPLGNFKYVVLAPGVIHSIYHYMVKDKNERDIGYLLIIPLLLWRMIHNQLWISLSRYRTTKGNARILDKGLEFDQVDRERNWDDQILLTGVLFYLVMNVIEKASYLPFWRADGFVMMFLLHAGPVEFLYYWLHRALHHHYLYSRYHSHHHSSIVTEPITSVIHPFAEHMAYFILFSIPLVTVVLKGTMSISAFFLYISYIDFMNNLGHCNFELIPDRLFSLFPPLKFLFYTPSYHSLHHTQFKTNYSLFMPFYDYIYGTMDKSSDTLYQNSLKRKEEKVDVIHLTHLTTIESIYHLRIGLAALASRPQKSFNWYLWWLSPITMFFTWFYDHPFVVETNQFHDNLKMQTWVIPKYTFQYVFQWKTQSINKMIEEAILKAEQKGCKVLSLGLLNQGEELNRYGGLYLLKYPWLKLKVVDGSSLVVAIVLNSIPKDTTQILLRGNLTKVAKAIFYSLCQRGIKVAVLHEEEHKELTKSFNTIKFESNVVLSKGYSQKIWLVGDGITDEEQMKAPKGTIFIPFSQFPPRTLRKDCYYHSTPAMKAPPSIENIHSCENWLGRRVMSAWRIGGIVHAKEGWKENECGYSISNIDHVWQSALKLGFQPLTIPTVYL